jgi:hypothetical protein
VHHNKRIELLLTEGQNAPGTNITTAELKVDMHIAKIFASLSLGYGINKNENFRNL